jgi:hypothetical protein
MGISTRRLSNPGISEMTLLKYQSRDLDDLALRVVDLASSLREMSKTCEENEILEIPMHSKKALDWLDNLEQWARKCQNDLAITVIKHRAARDAKRAANS